MTNDRMAAGYLSMAIVRADTLDLFLRAGSWSTVGREAQEAVELFLKAAMRNSGVEPVRIHDVAGILHENAHRFPEWFASRIPDLAAISTELSGDRGVSFYGDERRGIPPDQVFAREDADRAMEQVAFVRDLCARLVDA